MIRPSIVIVLLAFAAPAQGEERRYMFAGFDRIRVEGPFDVTVESGRSPGVVASGDQQALDLVSVRADGRTLVVAAGVNGWGGYPGDPRVLPTIRVTATDLRSAFVLGGGRLAIDRLVGQRVDAGVSGAGTLTVGAVRADRFDGALVGNGVLRVSGQAVQARFQANGAGEVDAAGLQARALSVLAQGSGTGRYAAIATAEISADGLGTIDVAGTPSCTIRGTAPVRCGTKR